MDKNPSTPPLEAAIIPIDPDSPIPLYYQVENDLRRLISAGQVTTGATMPPELELCRMYGVGRHTVRMALSRLVDDGLITRRAGRGTMVKPQTDRMKFYLDRSFTRQMADMGRQAHSKVLEMSAGVVDPDCPEIFTDRIGSGCWRLVRLRFGDSEPIGLQSTTILAQLSPGLDNYDFDQNSLYDVLAREYRLVITQIHHTISAAIADQFQAGLLQIAAGDPLLVVNTSARLDNGQVVEHTISHYRADRYEYSTTHTYMAS